MFILGAFYNPLRNSYIYNYKRKKDFKYKMYILGVGERRIMAEYIESNLSGQKFGKLELVDKEIFYLSFNTRDT